MPTYRKNRDLHAAVFTNGYAVIQRLTSMGKLTEDFRNEIEQLNAAFQLSVQKETYHPESFGNALVVLSGPQIRVRLIRDRDQFFLDVAPIGNYEWAAVDEIFESLGVSHRPDPDVAPTNTIQMLVDLREKVLAIVRERKASWLAPISRPPL